MRKSISLSFRAFALCVISALVGCGGSGGGSDDPAPTPTPVPTPTPTPVPTPVADPFSIDSYTEYKEGTSLSGIWMMVINAEYDVGSTRASESVRSTVFIKENVVSSYTVLEVSDPFCAPPFNNYYSHSYSGNNVKVRTFGGEVNLTVNDYSRMSGSLESHGYYCDASSDCDSDLGAKVEMVKVAPLPVGNWNNNFANAAPTIGTIEGVVQSDATTDALEFDDKVDCFVHSKGHGGMEFMLTGTSTYYAAPDYESIVVSTDKGDLVVTNKSGGVLSYEDIRRDNNYPNYISFPFSNRTNKFSTTIEGINPITISISADASGDSTSDGAALDIKIDI